LQALVDKVGKINARAFTTENANDMRNYLNLCNSIYMKVFNTNNDARDRVVREHTEDKDPKKAEAKKEAFNKLKNENQNEAIADFVTNKNEFNKIIEQDGILIQRSDPIFLEPYHSNFGNSHFFAPRKKIFGHYYDTYWVNICVLWGMSIIMVITLYFDLLRKLIDGIGSLAERFGKKKER
jgi:hypothetical protein